MDGEFSSGAFMPEPLHCAEAQSVRRAVRNILAHVKDVERRLVMGGQNLPRWLQQEQRGEDPRRSAQPTPLRRPSPPSWENMPTTVLMTNPPQFPVWTPDGWTHAPIRPAWPPHHPPRTTTGSALHRIRAECAHITAALRTWGEGGVQRPNAPWRSTGDVARLAAMKQKEGMAHLSTPLFMEALASQRDAYKDECAAHKEKQVANEQRTAQANADGTHRTSEAECTLKMIGAQLRALGAACEDFSGKEAEGADSEVTATPAAQSWRAVLRQLRSSRRVCRETGRVSEDCAALPKESRQARRAGIRHGARRQRGSDE